MLKDQDMITDILSFEKFLSTMYHTAVMEAYSDQVRNTLMQAHNEKLHNARQLFNTMSQKGWYQVPMVQQTGNEIRIRPTM